MGFNVNSYHVNVVDENGDFLITGVRCEVLTVNTRTRATIYEDDKLNAKTNPISTTVFATDDCIKFFSTAASVDLLIDVSGKVVVFADVTPNTGQLRMPKVSFPGVQHYKIAFGSATTETDTAVDLPDPCIVLGGWLEVVTVDATET